MSEPPPSNPATHASPPRVLLALWRDYPWITRAATVLLVLLALLNIILAADDGGAVRQALLDWLPAGLLAALASDGMTTLLTLVIALGIGLHIKQRQLRGLLDGTDHYDIGRALAFGYFSNFLVPALLLIRGESREMGRPIPFRMVFPRHVKDLDDFKTSVEPALRALAGKRDLEGVYRSGSGVIKRSLLVLSRSEGGELFFDFPTTLYTLHDYYESWNLWLGEQGKPTIDPRAIESMQQSQITAFLRHLGDLSRSQVGLDAVKHLGLIEVGELTGLFDEHFQTIEPRELPALLAADGG
jgi:hypothetical protein